MLVVIDVAGVGDDAKVAVARRQNGFGDAADVTLVLHAVADQVRDREHFQVVLRQNSWSCGTRDMVPSSFMISQMTRGRVEAGDAREVDAGFGLAGADEHAAVARAQREDVAGAGEILRPSLLDRWR